jgi:hypothetical protein
MKRVVILALALALTGAGAAPVAARTCTDEYMGCLNDSWDLNAFLRVIADFACFDDYTVCVSRRILGL